MKNIGKLICALDSAAGYFDSRGFSHWASEARHSIKLIESGDQTVIEKLYLKYAPTCEVEELFITEYEIEDEAEVVALNQTLAEVINDTFKAIEHVGSENF
ncbi:hypothetical protein OS175_09240 [Marinicella sp. S1101]|uniref:hypothetical protein n=1 Tax=Marinicella marina TaxID=2996016 RepID=UPI002260CCDA|nr:hypothetical protein [Marinicella marina]MCX7554061.1 hypothetical protein [Marinicella marina]MDJ1140553.1 hypothetical protein [Marinicella marina]